VKKERGRGRKRGGAETKDLRVRKKVEGGGGPGAGDIVSSKKRAIERTELEERYGKWGIKKIKKRWSLKPMEK